MKKVIPEIAVVPLQKAEADEICKTAASLSKKKLSRVLCC